MVMSVWGGVFRAKSGASIVFLVELKVFMWCVFFFLRIGRPPRSTQSRSSAASDVYKRQVWDLSVHGDSRGWFKENWQRQMMVAAGLPDFGPVQNNVSFNDAVGTTRGIHAEPVSYTHLRAHETVLDLVCRLPLEKINNSTLHIELYPPLHNSSLPVSTS